MVDYTRLYAQMVGTPLAGWLERLPAQVATALDDGQHGRLPQWRTILSNLPTIVPSQIDLRDGVRVGQPDDLTAAQLAQLESHLRQLHPWRKGPFHLYGLHIDTEWRSDWKWDRLKEGIGDLNGRLILDVGCGNGYYGWRMVGRGAGLVVGLDPFLLYVAQYQAVRQLIGAALPNFVLPLGIEALPGDLAAFDTVFSMGVLYHRRDPLAHLQTLLGCLRPGGELVLETLIIEDALHEVEWDADLPDSPDFFDQENQGIQRPIVKRSMGRVLVPKGRYAQMRNVYAIPTVPTLLGWLRQAGFAQATVLDVTPTTAQEQRSTEWMTFNSLPDFLDPQDPGRTIEGYPAPVRAVVVAKRP